MAQVVINRVKDKRWPNTVCGVVKQSKQFSWYPSKKLTNAKKDMAQRVLSGSYTNPVGTATHFRSDNGRWKRLSFVAQIGKHKFYQ